MPTKNVRIDVNAEEIALKYGSSVSKGIIEMNTILNNRRPDGVAIRNLPGDSSSVATYTAAGTSEKTVLQLAKEKFQNTPVPTNDVPILFNDAFWKKMGNCVQESVKDMVGAH